MRFLLCWCSSWHLHSSAFYFWSFRNAQKFCVSEPEPLPVAVLPLLLAFFLSGPSNQSMNWFWGGKPQPHSTPKYLLVILYLPAPRCTLDGFSPGRLLRRGVRQGGRAGPCGLGLLCGVCRSATGIWVPKASSTEIAGVLLKPPVTIPLQFFGWITWVFERAELPGAPRRKQGSLPALLKTHVSPQSWGFSFFPLVLGLQSPPCAAGQSSPVPIIL